MRLDPLVYASEAVEEIRDLRRAARAAEKAARAGKAGTAPTGRTAPKAGRADPSPCPGPGDAVTRGGTGRTSGKATASLPPSPLPLTDEQRAGLQRLFDHFVAGSLDAEADA